MKYLAIVLLLLSTNSFAYNIGGAYATLIDCSWGQHGYQYGYVGTYKTMNGQIYTVFFGSNYCQH